MAVSPNASEVLPGRLQSAASHAILNFLQSRLGAALALTGIIAAGVAIRSYQLSARSLWYDESFSWRLISFPFLEMIERTARDNHPPLYFILLKGWAAVFGESVFALRVFSVSCGALTILGMYLLIVEAFSSQVASSKQRARLIGLVVASLTAVSVFQIRWSWEIRMYTLATALAVFSSWAMLRALHSSSQKWRAWSLYGLLVLLFAYTHYYAIFSIAGQAIFILGYLLVQNRGNVLALLRDTRFRYSLLAAGIVVVGYLPWLPALLEQRRQVQDDYWIRPVAVTKALGTAFETFLEPQDAQPSREAGLAVTMLCALVLVLLLYKAGPGESYIFLAALAPVCLSLVVSAADTSIFNVRYFLTAHLFMLAALGVLLCRIRPAWLRAFVLVVVIAGGLWVHYRFWNKLDVANRPGGRAAAEYVVTRRQPGEAVIVCSPMLYLSALYHSSDRTDWYVYNDGRPFVHYRGAPVLLPNEQARYSDLKAMGPGRVWVIEQRGGGWPPNDVPVPAWWSPRGEASFPEVYKVQGTLVVREYQIQGK